MTGRGRESRGVGGAPRRSRGPFARSPHAPTLIGVGRIVMLGVAAISLYLVAPSARGLRILAATLRSQPRLVPGAGRAGPEPGCSSCSGWRAAPRHGSGDHLPACGNLVSRIVPGGAAAGAALQFRMLAAAGVEAARAVSGLTAFSLVQIASVLAATLAGPAGHRRRLATSIAVWCRPRSRRCRVRGGRRARHGHAPRRPSPGGRGAGHCRRPAIACAPPARPDRLSPERLLAERDAIRAVLPSRWPRVSLAVAGSG